MVWLQSSTIGGIFSVISFFAPLLAQLAYEFGQPEYFALAIFGLNAGINWRIKNLIASIYFNFYYWKNFMTSIDRFTFGINEKGIGFIPVVVGLFAIMKC